MQALYSGLVRKFPWLKASIQLFSYSLAANLLLLLSLGVVTRISSSKEIGDAAVMSAMAAFVSGLMTGRLHLALCACAPVDRVALHHASRLAILGSTTLLMGALSLLNIMIGAAWWFWKSLLVVILAAGMAYFELSRSSTLAFFRPSKTGQLSLIRAVIELITKATVGHLGSTSLLLAEATAYFLAPPTVPRSLAGTNSNLRFPYRQAWQDIRATLRRYQSFIILGTPSYALDTVSFAMVLPIVGYLYGPAEAALFAVAQRVAALPGAQVGRAIADSWQMTLAEYALRAEWIAARRAFKQLLIVLVGLGVLFFGISSTIAPAAFAIAFGESYAAAGWNFVYLAPTMFALFVGSPLSRTLTVLRRLDMKLFYDTLSLCATLTACALAATMNFHIHSFLVTLSVGQSLVIIIYLYLQWNVLSKASVR